VEVLWKSFVCAKQKKYTATQRNHNGMNFVIPPREKFRGVDLPSDVKNQTTVSCGENSKAHDDDF